MINETIPILKSESVDLLGRIDRLRSDMSQILDSNTRVEKGQFFTPSNLAQFMASMFDQRPKELNILDPGAGIGSLSAALILAACEWEQKPEVITVTAYESENLFLKHLGDTYNDCERICEKIGIELKSEILYGDFIREASDLAIGRTMFAPVLKKYNAVILNPPYKKINSISTTRRILKNIGIETSNLYSAFLWLAIRLLETDGELVSITPRSFCNGPYFFPFRKAFLKAMSLRRIHVFETRDKAFGSDDVLQENVVMHAAKSSQGETVLITTSDEPKDESITIEEVNIANVIHPYDKNLFIHIVPNKFKQQIGQEMRGLSTTLNELGISVSTGKVVDFRASQLLKAQPEIGTVPLIYPAHFKDGFIHWPNGQTKKPNALMADGIGKEADELLIPPGWYVLVKRFSSKEEKRRVVAAIYNPEIVSQQFIGVENHLNYYHQNGKGLLPTQAKGLSGFLNSTLVDEYFRQFSGHTQVNATDLRNLRYPNAKQLDRIGHRIDNIIPPQSILDQIVMEELGMTQMDTSLPESIQAKNKIDEALEILRAFGLPRMQQNQRSALTLLALLDIKPGSKWKNASANLRGITEMMDFFRDVYGITYAPNTRETVRRQTVHQFLQVGLVVANPDNITRPINSPHTKYQVESTAVEVIKTFGSYEWKQNLSEYLKIAQHIQLLQVRERDMTLIPVKLPDDKDIFITPGGQNILIKQIVEDFCPRFTPGGLILYLGDAGGKFAYYESEYLANLGIIIDQHSKIPDVVVHLPEKNWLVLIEAVTSHGPIDIKRQNELKELFKGSQAPLVFITAFPTKKTMVKFVSVLAWETDVWVAENPSHLIHFNGERFLGPY